jgi:hypothetical protein
MWSVYPEWGWGTDDSERALSYLKRFGSVSVLNGHIHQVMQKVEGHVTFHTAMSTAFPQPAPGSAPSPGPLKVSDDRLKKVLGLSRMSTRGAAVVVEFTAPPPGRYEIACSEFCGSGHGQMKAALVSVGATRTAR